MAVVTNTQNCDCAFFRFCYPLFHTFKNHTATKNKQQTEGNPVIPFHNILAGEQADTPTNQRGNCFDDAKNQASTQCFTKRGLYSVAPLPIDAANASIDIAKARIIVADRFIEIVSAGRLHIHVTHPQPNDGATCLWSRQPYLAARTTFQINETSMLIRAFLLANIL